ncbi:MAG TPA: hypothetical protein VF412_08240 [Bdellovibrio sp.]|uniref:hypothetical protein n=1 Tax=Bdellovibrio sp. TaxID=28201 RepID=UPI002F19FDDC
MNVVKSLKVILAFAVLCIITGFIWWKIHGENHLETSREAQIRTNMASLVTIEDGYFEEYGEYTDDFEELGYVPEGNQKTKFFLDKEEIPPQFRASISEKDLPFVQKDDYQILAIYTDLAGNATFWKFKKGGKLEQIEILQK